MITRTIKSTKVTVALYSYLNGAECTLQEHIFAGDEKSAKKGIAKLYRDKPHEVIATETFEQKYGMSVETFISNAEPID